jgi:hypothetical protein
MSDLAVLLTLIIAALVLFGLVWLCDAVQA